MIKEFLIMIRKFKKICDRPHAQIKGLKDWYVWAHEQTILPYANVCIFNSLLNH